MKKENRKQLEQKISTALMDALPGNVQKTSKKIGKIISKAVKQIVKKTEKSKDAKAKKLKKQKSKKTGKTKSKTVSGMSYKIKALATNSNPISHKTTPKKKNKSNA